MIYKYYSFNENSLSSLINKEIWMSSLSEFNDPFESLVTLDLGHEAFHNLFTKYISEKRVCCFSEHVNNILMWSHYADKHKGFCVGIDEAPFIKAGLLHKVKYSDIDSNIKNDILSSDFKGSTSKLYSTFMTHKHKDWEYEKEYRLIIHAENEKESGETLEVGEHRFKEIYFGCNMPQKHKDLIANIMGKEVIYYQAKTSKFNFSLEIEELSN